MWGHSRLNGKEAEMQQDPSRPRGFRVRWRHVLIGMIVPAVLVPVAIADTGTPVPLPCAGQLPSQYAAKVSLAVRSAVAAKKP